MSEAPVKQKGGAITLVIVSNHPDERWRTVRFHDIADDKQRSGFWLFQLHFKIVESICPAGHLVGDFRVEIFTFDE